MIEWWSRQVFKYIHEDADTGIGGYVPEQWDSVTWQIWASEMDGDRVTILWVTHYCNNEA